MLPSPPEPEDDHLERWLADQLAGEEDAPLADEAEPLSAVEIERILRKARGELPVGRPPERLPRGFAAPRPSEDGRPGIRDRLASAFHQMHKFSRVLIVAASLLLMLSGMMMVSERVRVLIWGPGGVVREIEVAPDERVEIRRGGQVIARSPAETGSVPLEPAADAAARVVDDADSGYRETGTGWRISTVSGGYQGHYRFNSAGARSAFWDFPGLPPGSYRVFATWHPHPNRAFEALFVIHDGDRTLGTVMVDQSQPPADVQAKGVGWKQLGAFTLTGPNLIVELDAARSKVHADATPGNSVSADAIMVVPIEPGKSGQEPIFRKDDITDP